MAELPYFFSLHHRRHQPLPVVSRRRQHLSSASNQIISKSDSAEEGKFVGDHFIGFMCLVKCLLCFSSLLNFAEIKLVEKFEKRVPKSSHRLLVTKDNPAQPERQQVLIVAH